MYYYYKIHKDPDKPGTYSVSGPLCDIYKAVGEYEDGYAQVLKDGTVIKYKEKEILRLSFPIKC